MEAQESGDFKKRLEARKEHVKEKMSGLVEDFFRSLARELSSCSTAEAKRTEDEAEVPLLATVEECLEEAQKKACQLLAMTRDEVCADYEQQSCQQTVGAIAKTVSVDSVSDEKTEELKEAESLVLIEVTTEVKKKKKRSLKEVKPSQQALICMNRSDPADKPYYCRWPDCDHVSKCYYNLAKHVRYRHFRLPITKVEQGELKIEDSRDAFKFVGRLTAEHPTREVLMPTPEDLHQPQYSKPMKYVCKEPNCGRAFSYKSVLVSHQQTHLKQSVKPFYCKWSAAEEQGQQCAFRTAKRNTLRRHIRQRHFKLPKTYKKQVAMQLFDDRNADDHIGEDAEMLSLL